jgi:hypothetical protein
MFRELYLAEPSDDERSPGQPAERCASNRLRLLTCPARPASRKDYTKPQQTADRPESLHAKRKSERAAEVSFICRRHVYAVCGICGRRLGVRYTGNGGL